MNNLHNEKRPKRHTSDIRPDKRNKTKRGRRKKKKKTQTRWNIKLNHQPKKRQRRRSFILGHSNWKFFQVGYPVDTPTGSERVGWVVGGRWWGICVDGGGIEWRKGAGRK